MMRPRYYGQERPRICIYCGTTFAPAKLKQETCGRYACRKAAIAYNALCRAADKADAHKARVDAAQKSWVTRKLRTRMEEAA
jgi:hypothetical protein